MRIFKVKIVARFTRHEKIDDASLIEAVERAAIGLIDADLGGGLIKQRVARQGQGRRGGYRMMVGFRSGDRAVFLLGFAKNDLDNIDDRQLEDLRRVGNLWLSANTAKITEGLTQGLLIEVKNDDKTKK